MPSALGSPHDTQVPVQAVLQQYPSTQLPLWHCTPHPQASPMFLPRVPSSLVQAAGWSALAPSDRTSVATSVATSFDRSAPPSRVGVLVFEQANPNPITSPDHTSKTLAADRRC
jgi:hypothetical protein